MGGTLRDVPSFLWSDARLNEKKENMGVPQDSTEKKFFFLLFEYRTWVEVKNVTLNLVQQQ